MRAAVIADDLTGAADTGAQLARARYRTAVAFHGAPVPPDDDLDAVVVDTDSRLLAPAAAAARVETVARALRRVPLLYKKVDSTLRGAVGAEVRAALDGAGRPRAIVAPAFPAAGRTTRGGVQHVDGRAVPGEADLAPLLAHAGLAPVVVLARAEAADPHRLATALRDHACVIADVEEDADLAALVHAVADRADVLWVGSAGLAGALAAFRPGPRPPTSAVTATSVGEAAVLVAIGSDSPTAHAQVRRLASVPEVADVPLRLDLLVDGREEDAIEQAVDAAAEALGASRPALVHVTATDVADGRPCGAAPTAAPGAADAELARRIPPALAAVAERLAGDGRIDALVLSGGTTAVHVGRALGAHGLLLDGELEPGVPVGRLIGPRPFPVVTKAGGFGGETTLVHAVDALGGRLGARTAGGA